MKFLASMGHSEYGNIEAVPGLTIREVWPTEMNADPDSEQVYFMRWAPWMELPQEELEQRFAEVTGGMDADPSWEHIMEWEGDEDAVRAGLDLLIADIDTEPSGDDDVLDYWPSGVRYALAVASQLGDEQMARVQNVARRVIVNSHWAEEWERYIADKIGVDLPEPEATVRDGTVYVIVRQDEAGAIVDLEVLDLPPTWAPLPGQACWVANINGGDSAPYPMTGTGPAGG